MPDEIYAYVGNDPVAVTDPFGLCPTCTDLQRAAAQLSKSLSSISDTTGDLAITGFVVAAISGIGEVPSFGADTPATLSAAAVTGFFADASLITGGGAAALHSFANGDTASLAHFDFNRIEEFGITAALSRLPGGVGKYGEAIGGLAGKAMDIAAEAASVCSSQ